MPKFYTSEILLLPALDGYLTDEEKLNFIQQSLPFYLRQHPDLGPQAQIQLFNPRYESFKIEEARRLLAEAALSSGFQGNEERVLVLLNFASAGSEAQNACLKVIEESPDKTLILLPLANTQNILPTILSRCLIKRFTTEPNNADKNLPSAQTETLPTSYSQAVRLAEKYKNKVQGLALVKNLLDTLDKKAWQERQILAKCLEQLQGNFNPALTLENAFFQILALHSPLAKKAL